MKVSKNILQDNIKRLFKKPDFYFCVIFTLLNLVMTKWILQSNGVSGFIIIALVELMIEIIFLFIILKTKNKKWPLEKKFLLIAIPLGIIFIILLPPGQSPDERNHFRRAYGIASGSIIAERVGDGGGGSYLPDNIDDSLVSAPEHGVYSTLSEKIGTATSTEQSLQKYQNTAIYNFIAYIPQTLAALVGKIFGFSILMTAYLMVFFNFIIWLILVYFAIKFVPKLKTLLFFIALSPMTLQGATSLSIDGLTVGLVMFLISFVCYLAYSKKGVMNKKELVILYTIAALIGLFKIVYAPLVLLYFLIPYERFGSKKQKFLHAGIMASVFLLVNISWFIISSSLGTVLQPGVNMQAQTVWILKHPISYLMRIVATTDLHVYNWLAGMLGLQLGAFDMLLPNIYFFIAFGFFIVTIAQRHDAIKVKTIDRLVFTFTFVIIIALIFTSEYLQWTAYGAEIIEGVQGRYLIPLIPLIPLAIARKNSKDPHMELITVDRISYYAVFINLIAFITFFAKNIAI